jgi:hypothetical protein
MADQVIGDGEQTTEQPRRRRRKTYYAALLHIRELTAHCRVRDLSEGGALIETNMPLWEGAPCVLDIPRVGQVRGTLIWCSWPRSGMSFESPLDIRAMDNLLGEPPTPRQVVAVEANWRQRRTDSIKIAHERARDAVSWLRHKPK